MLKAEVRTEGWGSAVAIKAKMDTVAYRLTSRQLPVYRALDVKAIDTIKGCHWTYVTGWTLFSSNLIYFCLRFTACVTLPLTLESHGQEVTRHLRSKKVMRHLRSEKVLHHLRSE